MGVLLYDFVMNMLPFSSGLLLAVVKTIYFEHFKGCHVIIYNFKKYVLYVVEAMLRYIISGPLSDFCLFTP